VGVTKTFEASWFSNADKAKAAVAAAAATYSTAASAAAAAAYETTEKEKMLRTWGLFF
jgi:hypothetical protein